MLTVSERGPIHGTSRASEGGNSPAGATAPTVVERLRQVVETAPAAIIVASSDGTVVAANREALTLLGGDHVDQLRGTHLIDRVANEDRERFRDFAAQVADGKAGTVLYGLAAANGAMRSVETRAVPLSRDGGARTLFLSVTWDVTERSRAAHSDVRQARERAELLDAQLVAQREAYEGTLKEARAASDRMKQDVANKRKALGSTIRRVRARGQTKLAEAREEHERFAAESEAERQSLLARLRAADDRQVSAEALAEERARQLATLEAQHAASLAAQEAENGRFQATLDETRARLATLNEERNERERLELTLHDERSQRMALLDQRERWRAKLSEVLEAMSQNAGSDSLSRVAISSNVDAWASRGAATNLQSPGESQWEF